MDFIDENKEKTKDVINNYNNKCTYIRVQNIIKDAKIKKYVKDSEAISSERISFWGGFTGKNTLQLEKARNIKLRIELLQSKKIQEKDKYESLDMMADIYACAISELSGNFTKEMRNMYDEIKQNCKEENISDENIYKLACKKINDGQSYLPVIHKERPKGIFGNTKTQIEFYKIENTRLENEIILERGKSQFGTFSYECNNVSPIIPVNIKNNKKSLTNE